MIPEIRNISKEALRIDNTPGVPEMKIQETVREASENVYSDQSYGLDHPVYEASAVTVLAASRVLRVVKNIPLVIDAVK